MARIKESSGNTIGQNFSLFCLMALTPFGVVIIIELWDRIMKFFGRNKYKYTKKEEERYITLLRLVKANDNSVDILTENDKKFLKYFYQRVGPAKMIIIGTKAMR